MKDARFDVIGIGNAIVDVLTHADDTLLESQGLAKGSMTIIDFETAQRSTRHMTNSVKVSGGSAANTVSGIVALGGKCAFIGKVSDDALGDAFNEDICDIGVSFEAKKNTSATPTAQCLIFVTPDAERTMQTYLGACVELGPEDIDESVILDSQITYLEGYLFDPPKAKKAFVKAAKLAKAADRQVSLSLSDSFCVDRHRDEFFDLIEDYVNILFANEDEIKALFRTNQFDDAVKQARRFGNLAVLTRGAKGSVLVADNEIHEIQAEKVNNVVDTTGAGDLYAAGFLYGLTHGKDLQTCGKIGGLLASEIISQYGARPTNDLKAVLQHKLK